jgi:hypothetical protein
LPSLKQDEREEQHHNPGNSVSKTFLFDTQRNLPLQMVFPGGSKESQLKKIYVFSLAGLQLDSDSMLGGVEHDIANKVLVLDKFFSYEKVEGLALAPDSDFYNCCDVVGRG